jgi:diguanylate cyclase (GGDEF)-like protein
LNRLVNLDGLTQVPNRRCFDEFLQQQWESHAQSHKSLSLILLDVDYFKQYNDRYGHLAGDDCLKQVAQAIGTTLKRPKDFVGRYGGEEFAIVLPGSDEGGAVCIAEFIQTTIAALRIPHERSQISDRLTLSLGVASGIPQPDDSPQTLILAADRALYEAKANGRNRIATYPLSDAE